MFDRLVESEPAGAVRSRRNYFVVTSFAMGLLSLTAVVLSIFADDYSLNASIELSELISPVEMAQVAPEQPQPRPPMPRTQQSSTLPTREVAMARVEDTLAVPTTISTASNTHLSIPITGRFILGTSDSNPATRGGDPGASPSRGAGGNGNGLSLTPAATAIQDDNSAPPAVRKAVVPKVVSLGVVNGKATYLPKPAYPPAAQAVAASGMVEVQVLIDETGHVVSAHAARGNPLLRAAAERAALGAKFTPTLLSNTPVKVAGIITYNFLRG
jgi:TonB family protein